LDEHQLISALKTLALELGQTPTITQFNKYAGKGCARYRIYWPDPNSWAKFIEAAGLAPTRITRKIDNRIFEKKIEKHLGDYSPPEIIKKIPWPKIAILGDLHEPFGSDHVKAEFVLFCQKVQPDYIIQMGDLLDMYSHTKFPKSHNVFTPKDEEAAAIKNAKELWTNLRKAAPNAKCVGLLGNHDVRPLKRTLESLPQVEHWIQKYFNELFQFDGVEMILDPRQEYIIADIAFIHGYLNQLGAHRDFMLMNTVRGHDHVGGVVFRQIHGKTLWELDAGLAGDYNAKGFTYTPQKMTKQTNGFASIDEYGPRFIPL
jgi:hypothetical protein